MPKVSAIVLGAGASSRFGAANKLLADVCGKPLICRVVEAIAASPVAEIIVVTGRDREDIESALNRFPARFAHNEAWQTGLASSIRTGLGAFGNAASGAFIIPGDMPFLTASVVSRLVEEFTRADCAHILYPATPSGEQRNPVLWPARLFGELASLDGHQGGKKLLKRHSGTARPVRFDDPQIFADIDTIADLMSVRAVLTR